MARAQFHKNQRVYVKPVGTWALIERVVPHWTKGFEEPIRIYYDCGLGRDFATDELQGETSFEHSANEDEEQWRLTRAQNKWQSSEETAHHPHPGTYPVVVTSDNEWGGWRVPGAEYALSPTRVERQARLITATPRMAKVIRKLVEWAKSTPDDVPAALVEIAQDVEELSDYLEEVAEA
jgi:hypothetical protein